MPTVIIENEWKNRIQLTQNETRWQLIGMTGLNPPPAGIATSVVSGFDGSRYNISRMEERNIVISLSIHGNAETNRGILNEIILPKRYIKVYYKNNTVNVYIEGYVETHEYDVFENRIIVQTSIICPSPYWIDMEENEVVLSSNINLFEFPYSIPQEGIAMSEKMTGIMAAIKNSGTILTGATIVIECSNKVLNPTVTNLTTRESMTFNTVLEKGDRIVVSTVRGNKYISMYSGKSDINAINCLDKSSKWITIVPGENIFSVNAKQGMDDITATISVKNLYGGV